MKQSSPTQPISDPPPLASDQGPEPAPPAFPPPSLPSHEQPFQRKRITKKLLEGFKALPQNAFDRSYHQAVMQKVFQAVHEENPDLLFRSLVFLKWAGLIDLQKDEKANSHLHWLALCAEDGDMAARAMIEAIAKALTAWGTGPPKLPEEQKVTSEEKREGTRKRKQCFDEQVRETQKKISVRSGLKLEERW